MTDNKLAELKARAEKARQDQTRAEIERDNAQAAREKALAELKAEFNVSDPKLGANLLQNMSEEYQDMLRALEESLDEIS